jgi:hypothetical protein
VESPDTVLGTKSFSLRECCSFRRRLPVGFWVSAEAMLACVVVLSC